MVKISIVVLRVALVIRIFFIFYSLLPRLVQRMFLVYRDNNTLSYPWIIYWVSF